MTMICTMCERNDAPVGVWLCLECHEELERENERLENNTQALAKKVAQMEQEQNEKGQYGSRLIATAREALPYWIERAEAAEAREGELRAKVGKLREIVWLQDIPHPIVPEYVEHHASITKILKYIDGELLGQALEGGNKSET